MLRVIASITQGKEQMKNLFIFYSIEVAVNSNNVVVDIV